MAAGDIDNDGDYGDGATGDEVDDDGDGATGDDNDNKDDGDDSDNGNVMTGDGIRRTMATTMATTMAADDNDNEVDGDGATGDDEASSRLNSNDVQRWCKFAM